MGCTNQAANAIVDDQGINRLHELRYLTDTDIETLCKNVKPPGRVAAGNGGGANLGHMISHRAEMNIKLAAYWLQYSEKISHPRIGADLTVPVVRSIRALRDAEGTCDDPSAPTINDRNWPRTFHAIDEYFQNSFGMTNIPLAHVMREHFELMEGEEDAWDDPLDQMIDQAPHFIPQVGANPARHPTSIMDNKTVFDELAEMTRNYACWSYVKPFLRSHNGRATYVVFHNHYLGLNNIDNMAALAEQKLNSTTYKREGRRWDFEQYVTVHQEQHTILEGLVSHGYAGIDKRSKACYLMNGIKSNILDSIKTQILSNSDLQNDFAQCVVLFKDYLAQTKANKNPELNVSAVNSQREGTECDPKKCKVEDRYYTMKEYHNLTPDQKKEPKDLRDACGHNPKRTKKRSLKTQVATLAQQIATMQTIANGIIDGTAQGSSNSQDNHQENTHMSQGTRNHNHPALTRQ